MKTTSATKRTHSGPIDLGVVKLSGFTIEKQGNRALSTASGSFIINEEAEVRQWSLRVWEKDFHGGRLWSFTPTAFLHSHKANVAIKKFLKLQM